MAARLGNVLLYWLGTIIERDKAARAVMLEVRELMEVQAHRIDDLKAERAQMVVLLKQAHDRQAIIDVNIPADPEIDHTVGRSTVRRGRH